jgi:hypothetical protein
MRVAVVGATGRVGAATDHDEAVAFFSRSARNLLEAEQRS